VVQTFETTRWRAILKEDCCWQAADPIGAARLLIDDRVDVAEPQAKALFGPKQSEFICLIQRRPTIAAPNRTSAMPGASVNFAAVSSVSFSISIPPCVAFA
jgi:hypothetical protein